MYLCVRCRLVRVKELSWGEGGFQVGGPAPVYFGCFLKMVVVFLDAETINKL